MRCVGVMGSIKIHDMVTLLTKLGLIDNRDMINLNGQLTNHWLNHWGA